MLVEANPLTPELLFEAGCEMVIFEAADDALDVSDPNAIESVGAALER